MQTYKHSTLFNGNVFHDIKAVIFDYGGTLDSAGRHWSHILREGYSAAGITLSDDRWKEAYVFGERALAKNYIVVSEDNFHDVLLKKIDREFFCLEEQGRLQFVPNDRKRAVEKVADYCYRYAAGHVDMSRNVIVALAERFPLALVSNFYGNINAVLRDFRLEYFRTVIESSVVGVRKPDPAIFRLGLNALGTQAAETLVVGDSYDKDIVPAKFLGCPTVWLRGEGWGKEPDDTGAADVIISDIRQLISLFPKT